MFFPPPIVDWDSNQSQLFEIESIEQGMLGKLNPKPNPIQMQCWIDPETFFPPTLIDGNSNQSQLFEIESINRAFFHLVIIIK